MIQRRLIPTYIFLAIVSFISVFPFYWMISAATNTSFDVAQGRILPGGNLAVNFQNLIGGQNLAGRFWFRALSRQEEGYGIYHSASCHDDSGSCNDDSSVLDDRGHEFTELCARLYSSGNFYAVFDYDVPAEFQELSD